MHLSYYYYSFFYGVKQWSNNSNNAIIKMTDQKQNDFDIKPYLSIEDDDVDPIEIYAYYLGLYINNMRNKIYMKYILSRITQRIRLIMPRKTIRVDIPA